MKIRLSQLRSIIKEEVSRVLSEATAVEPTGITTPGGAEIFVSYTSAPAGHFAALLASGVDPRRVARTFPSEHSGLSFVMGGPKGRASATKLAALSLLRAAASKEVAKLSSNPDARPSELSRLELLQAFLDG